MATIVDGKAIVNAAYHGTVVAGITIGVAKLLGMVIKKATLPKLDADVYDIGMLTLDISAALLIQDLLIKQGLIPADIMK